MPLSVINLELPSTKVIEDATLYGVNVKNNMDLPAICVDAPESMTPEVKIKLARQEILGELE